MGGEGKESILKEGSEPRNQPYEPVGPGGQAPREGFLRKLLVNKRLAVASAVTAMGGAAAAFVGFKGFGGGDGGHTGSETDSEKAITIENHPTIDVTTIPGTNIPNPLKTQTPIPQQGGSVIPARPDIGAERVKAGEPISDTEFVAQVWKEINIRREAAGLGPLVNDPELQEIAEQVARDLFKKGVFEGRAKQEEAGKSMEDFEKLRQELRRTKGVNLRGYAAAYSGGPPAKMIAEGTSNVSGHGLPDSKDPTSTLNPKVGEMGFALVSSSEDPSLYAMARVTRVLPPEPSNIH